MTSLCFVLFWGSAVWCGLKVTFSSHHGFHLKSRLLSESFDWRYFSSGAAAGATESSAASTLAAWIVDNQGKAEQISVSVKHVPKLPRWQQLLFLKKRFKNQPSHTSLVEKKKCNVCQKIPPALKIEYSANSQISGAHFFQVFSCSSVWTQWCFPRTINIASDLNNYFHRF